MLIVRDPFHLNGVMKQRGDVLTPDEVKAIMPSVDDDGSTSSLIGKCVQTSDAPVEPSRAPAPAAKSKVADTPPAEPVVK